MSATMALSQLQSHYCVYLKGGETHSVKTLNVHLALYNGGHSGRCSILKVNQSMRQSLVWYATTNEVFGWNK